MDDEVSLLLNKFKVTADHFKSSFTNPLEAIAQLVDNSRDANAKNLRICREALKNKSNEFAISFTDDGDGLDRNQLENFLNLSGPKVRPNKIGLYGEGLKKASFKIGNNMMLFTKKDDLMSIIFFSSDLNKDLKEMIVPMPCFHKNKTPQYDQNLNTELRIRKHEKELSLIYHYSPFRSLNQLLSEFDKINSQTGTRVFIYNLIQFKFKKEIEFKKVNQKSDIIYTNFGDPILKKDLKYTSLREYLSFLYYKPEMLIFIEDDRVRAKFFEKLLFEPIKYESMEKLFKNNQVESVASLNETRNTLENEIRKDQTTITNMKKNAPNFSTNVQKIDFGHKINELQMEVGSKKAQLENLEKTINKEKRPLPSKKIHYLCGIYLDSRGFEGIYVYNNGRLIMVKDSPRNVNFRGVVCLINVGYDVLEPSNLKNCFKNELGQKRILRKANEIVCTYSRTNFTLLPEDENELWKDLGYPNKSSDEPGTAIHALKYRIQSLKGLNVQCFKCKKWRLLDWCDNFEKRIFPSDEWECHFNRSFSCSMPEEYKPIKIVKYVNANNSNNHANIASPTSTGNSKKSLSRSKPRSVSREAVKTVVPLQSKTLLNPLKRPLSDSSTNDLINSKMPRPDPNILTPMVKKHTQSNQSEASRATCSANQNLIDNTASTQPKRKTTSSITITRLGPNRLAPEIQLVTSILPKQIDIQASEASNSAIRGPICVHSFNKQNEIDYEQLKEENKRLKFSSKDSLRRTQIMARNLLISYNFEKETQHTVDIEINNATDVEAVERIVDNLITKKRGEKDKENNNVRNNAIKKTMRVFNDILNDTSIERENVYPEAVRRLNSKELKACHFSNPIAFYSPPTPEHPPSPFSDDDVQYLEDE